MVSGLADELGPGDRLGPGSCGTRDPQAEMAQVLKWQRTPLHPSLLMEEAVSVGPGLWRPRHLEDMDTAA